MPTGTVARSANKQLVERLVDEVINSRRFDLLGDIASGRLAPKLRTAYEQFVAAFPDWHQQILHLVEEDDVIAAHFRCTGTQHGDWEDIPATGCTMNVDEIAFLTIADGRITRYSGLEDTTTRTRQLSGEPSGLGDLGSLG